MVRKFLSQSSVGILLICLGTVPTLIVPTLETIGAGVNTKYRSLRDTVVGFAFGRKSKILNADKCRAFVIFLTRHVVPILQTRHQTSLRPHWPQPLSTVSYKLPNVTGS